MRPLLSLFAVTALLLGLVGCDDGALGDSAPTAPRATVRAEAVPKLRQTIDAVAVPGLAAVQAANGPRYLVSFASPTTVEASRFVGRYTFLTNSRFVGRYNGQTGRTDTLGVTAIVDTLIYDAIYDDDDDDDCDDDDCDNDLEEALLLLSTDPDTDGLEPDIPVGDIAAPRSQKNQTGQATPWGITRINAQTPPPAGLSAVDLYIVDTAIRPEDLNRLELLNFGGNPNPAIHGYHVAGTAGALNNTSGVVGVAPGVRIRNFSVLDATGKADLSIVIQAVEEVRKRKLLAPATPVVLNLSLGAATGTTTLTALDESVLAAIQAGVVVVVAAGNEGVNVNTVTPARVAAALTVGAYDANNRFAAFSNRGAGVDLLAPGVNILSLGLNARGRAGLAISSGTSMAAPHVAGAAARYLAANPTATPAQVATALVAASQPTITNVPAGTTNRTVYVSGF